MKTQLKAPHSDFKGQEKTFTLVRSLSQDSEKYVEQLLTLFNRFSRLVKEAFQDDPRFLTARDKVSSTFQQRVRQQHTVRQCS